LPRKDSVRIIIVHITPDICGIVDELVWHFDEPFADSSAIPTYMVSKLARACHGNCQVTVAMNYLPDTPLRDRKRNGFASARQFRQA
jgi:hypothetical protein